MKILILQENLLKTLTRVGRIISTKSQLPVLQNVHIKTENGIVRITSTNTETTISSLVGAKIESEGEICVSAKLLTELVSSLPQETVTLEEKEGHILVSTTRTKAELSAMPAEEFPPIKIEVAKGGLTMEKAVVTEALSATLYAAATDDGRPLLTGIKIVSDGENLVFAATDGYRLSVKRMVQKVGENFDMVVPARAMMEVYKTLMEDKEEKTLGFGKNEDGQLCLSVGDTTVLARLIDGEYPPYSKIIPKNHTSSANFDKGEFQQAVKSASIFARDNANIVRVHLEKGGITVSANTPQVGQNTVSVEAKVEGDAADIAFNSRFLLDFLSNCSVDELTFEMTGSLNPGLFRKDGDDSFIHIIMPVRVQN
jgi:DNA polymerase III subunit beta